MPDFQVCSLAIASKGLGRKPQGKRWRAKDRSVLALSFFALHFLPDCITCTTDFLVGRRDSQRTGSPLYETNPWTRTAASAVLLAIATKSLGRKPMAKDGGQN